jgi:hypothetical protein
MHSRDYRSFQAEVSYRDLKLATLDIEIISVVRMFNGSTEKQIQGNVS